MTAPEIPPMVRALESAVATLWLLACTATSSAVVETLAATDALVPPAIRAVGTETPTVTKPPAPSLVVASAWLSDVALKPTAPLLLRVRPPTVDSASTFAVSAMSARTTLPLPVKARPPEIARISPRT